MLKQIDISTSKIFQYDFLNEFGLGKEQWANYSYSFVGQTIYYSLLPAESEQKRND